MKKCAPSGKTSVIVEVKPLLNIICEQYIHNTEGWAAYVYSRYSIVSDFLQRVKRFANSIRAFFAH
jgi:hypothetical protein